MRDRQFDALVAAASGAVPVPHGEHADASADEHTDNDHSNRKNHHVGHDDAENDHAGHDDADEEWAIEFDGLRVTETADGYRFETAETTATGLDRAELRDHADGSPYVTNWYFWEWEVRRHGRPKRAFLRRAEAADEHAPPERYAALADGMVTEWGQLRIEATLDEHGERRYTVRHVDEASVPREQLTVYRDPLAAREIAETDANDRYRPLKTAPSLAGGWLFPELDWREVTRLVDEFYPATIANWHRERRGELDVDHWRDTADRQTGIYDIVEELDRDAVDRIAASCCDDSQCLKRREWEYDAETPLAADGGSGVFPCREPCSLVVAASRKWTTLERETERTYEFTMTPSEKDQLEAILDAVADGRVGQIREADVYEGANRYRARYLREKRLDSDGNLCGVPSEPNDAHTDGHDAHDTDDGDDAHDTDDGDDAHDTDDGHDAHDTGDADGDDDGGDAHDTGDAHGTDDGGDAHDTGDADGDTNHDAEDAHDADTNHDAEDAHDASDGHDAHDGDDAEAHEGDDVIDHAADEE